MPRFEPRLRLTSYKSRCAKCHAPVPPGVYAYLWRDAPGARWSVQCEPCGKPCEPAPPSGNTSTPIGECHTNGVVDVDGSRIFVTYPDVDSFLRDALQPVRSPEHRLSSILQPGRGLGKMYGEVEGGAGVDTFDDASKLASGGWLDGASKIANAVPTTTPPVVKSSRRRARWADDGETFDRERFNAGREDCYQVYRREMARGSGHTTARIVVRIGANSGSDSADWLWTGAAAMVWADALETAGRRVRIDLGFALTNASSHTSESGCLVTVKDYDQPLAPERLAFWTAHASAFRVFGFRWLLAFPGASYGLGCPIDIPQSALDAEPGTIYVPRLKSKSSAADWLKCVAEGFESATVD